MVTSIKSNISIYTVRSPLLPSYGTSPKPRGTNQEDCLKPNIFVCVAEKVRHVCIQYLIYTNHSRLHVIQQNEHLHHDSSLSALFINESIFYSGKRSLYCQHFPLCGLPCWRSLPSKLVLEILLSSCWCRRTQKILTRFQEVIPLVITKCRVDTALPPRCFIHLLKFFVYIS